jgi:hypothetical protein
MSNASNKGAQRRTPVRGGIGDEKHGNRVEPRVAESGSQEVRGDPPFDVQPSEHLLDVDNLGLDLDREN